MFTRITRYKMKPGSFDEGKAVLEKMKPQILALPGLVHFINAANQDGTGYVVSVVESEEISNANADKVAAIWAEFAHLLEAAPVPEGYEVIANWSA